MNINFKFSQNSKHYSSDSKLDNKKRLSQDQVRLLEASFNANKKLDPERKLQLAHQLGVPPRQIAIWYQNKRARWKNQRLELDYDTLHMRLETTLAQKRQLEKEVHGLQVELQKSQAEIWLINQVQPPNCDDQGGSSSLHDHMNWDEQAQNAIAEALNQTQRPKYNQTDPRELNWIIFNFVVFPPDHPPLGEKPVSIPFPTYPTPPKIVDMASTSATRVNGGGSRIRTAGATLSSDNQSLIGEIRKGMIMMKDIAVDLEGDKQSQLVKELEAGFIQLLEASEDCMNFSSAIESVGNGYEPGEEPTDFKKLVDDEIAKLKASSSLVPQNDPLFRQFTTAIWNVHHAGQPMPGEEQEDIVVTRTQCNLLNTTCPLSGKSVIALSDPVRSMECKHIYEKMVIMQYIRSRKGRARCPITGCPKILEEDRVVCDPLLRIEIDEMQAMSKQTATHDNIEDVTDQLNEEDEESG